MTGPCVQRSIPGNMNCMNNNIESGGRDDKDPVSRDHHNSYRNSIYTPIYNSNKLIFLSRQTKVKYFSY